MKIFLISNSYWNFYNFRKQLIAHLINSGYEVCLFASNDNYKKYFQNKKIKLNSLNFSSRKISFYKDFFLILELYKILKLEKPDIILTFTIKPNIYVSLISRVLKIRVINNITGLGTSFLKNKLVRIFTFFLYKFSISNSKLVFFQNSYDQDLFLKNKIVTKKNSEVIPGSGVDIDYFESRHNIPKDITIFLYSGRLLKEKGIYEFLNAASIILKKNNHCEFHIIGKYYEDDKSSIKLKELKKFIKDNNKIKYFGFVEDSKKYYEQSTCIILPSYREGLSKSLLEASSMSRPVIATDVPGCNDIVQHDFNGYLSKVRDTQSLISSIELFLNQSYERKIIMGNNSRKIVENKFKIDLVISKYLKRIKDIIKS